MRRLAGSVCIPRSYSLILACLVVVMSAVRGEALVAQLTDDALVRLSRTIVEGQVTAVRSEWNSEHNQIFTTVTIRVSGAIKGGASQGSVLELRLLGGCVGDMVMEVIDQPTFVVGEDVIVFVREKSYQMMPVTGLSQGKFTVVTDPSTGIRSVRGRDVSRDEFVRGISRLVATENGER